MLIIWIELKTVEVQLIMGMKFFQELPGDHPYHILAKNLAAFFPCPKNLPEAKLKSFGLVALAEEISRQPKVVTF